MTKELLLKICGELKNSNNLTVQDSINGFEGWFVDLRNGVDEIMNNLRGVLKNDLTDDEAFFILCYTGTYSGWINSELRQGKKPSCSCKKAFIEGLDEALLKVESYNEQMVYRADTPGNPQKALNWFSEHIGSGVRLPYYLSTSFDDIDNTDISWRIKTSAANSFAKDISEITSDKFEREVLFMRNSTFKIVSVDRVKHLVHLEETIDLEVKPIDLIGAYYED